MPPAAPPANEGELQTQEAAQYPLHAYIYLYDIYELSITHQTASVFSEFEFAHS